MKMFSSIFGRVLPLVFCVTSALAAESLLISDLRLFDSATNNEPILVAQSGRGCCVLRASSIKCAYTSKQYCEAQAKNAGVAFEFYQGKSCRETRGCPAR